MLLTNLTLALGLIGTSITGSAMAMRTNNQNNLMISQKKPAVVSKHTYSNDGWSLVN